MLPFPTDLIRTFVADDVLCPSIEIQSRPQDHPRQHARRCRAVAEIGERRREDKAADGAVGGGGADGKKKRLPLAGITRYTMVKRIW